MSWIENYAKLLVGYSLFLKRNEKVFVRTTSLAEPLIKEFYKAALQAGALVEFEITFEDQENILQTYGGPDQLNYISPAYKEAIYNYDAILTIRAPHDSNEKFYPDVNKKEMRSAALAPLDKVYFERLGTGNLKRTLCQYPTQYAADLAGMTMKEYTAFIQSACFLHCSDPAAEWKKLSVMQQAIVDYLNQCNHIIYRHPRFEISFSVKGRIWINSDGKANMPSGEVFTSPVEDSVQGEIYFSYPSMIWNDEVNGVRLIVKNGEVTEWYAEKGLETLNKVFQMEGSRKFGEVAIATNQNIQRPTKNILFDEKIGGTVHMAIGQSYLQTGGKNISPIHWDLITDMRDGGEIFADGKLIYLNGKFVI